ncbi:nitroreductase/quinone reductase family protein [Nonomuraea sp. NPDC049714]|uniref:nitroreductase/quinone reductase family protein n=1 Tax=Nonomuraea sp. NPDC049714 TaxID=3364357 RepID=UPI0037B580A9
MTNLVLTVKGRKSGRWLRTGLFFGEDDGRYVLIASGSAVYSHAPRVVPQHSGRPGGRCADPR